MKNALIQFVEDQVQVKDFPQFKSGDTITVTYKIVEGNKERLQKFQGVVSFRHFSAPGARYSTAIAPFSKNSPLGEISTFLPRHLKKEPPRL